MAKNEVEKLTKWEQLKMKSKVVRKVTLNDLESEDGELFQMGVQSVSQATLDAINEKYDDMKEPRPTIKMNGKYVECPEDSREYLEWQKKNKAIDSLRMAELALAFMVDKPSGNTIEEQIKELKEFIRPGDYIKIIQNGYEACGHTFDQDKIDAAKNS